MRLFLCEKPSQGKDIGRVLGAVRDGGGCVRGDGIVVTWCIGHLLEMAPPDAYDAVFKRWDLEALPILPGQWRMTVKDKARGQYRRVQELLGEAKEVVIATDADREGEMIAREVLEHCRWRGPVRRLWLSALDPASIRKALAQLQPGERTAPLYQAGMGRARADWMVGMNLTRAYTTLGQRGGHEGVLSVGRVQTPTLALVVARDREIEGFKPVPYYELLAQLAVRGGRFTGRWRPAGEGVDERGRCLEPDEGGGCGAAGDWRSREDHPGAGGAQGRTGPAAVQSVGAAAGGLQALGDARQSRSERRTGAVRDPQGHDLPPDRLRPSAGVSACRGAGGAGSPGAE